MAAFTTSGAPGANSSTQRAPFSRASAFGSGVAFVHGRSKAIFQKTLRCSQACVRRPPEKAAWAASRRFVNATTAPRMLCAFTHWRSTSSFTGRPGAKV